MLRVSFDDWPILTTIAAGVLVDHDVLRACKSYEAAFARGGRFVSLIDASQLEELPGSLLRKTYVEWRRAHVWDLRRHVIAVAVNVGRRPFVRGAFTALSWFAPHPAPEAFFTERAPARSYCEMALWTDAAR
jgi:hypothetical protein